MKNNFSLKFKIFDIFILAFALVAIVISIVTTNVVFAKGLMSENSVVEIYYHNEILKDKKVEFKDVKDEVKIVLTKEEYPDLLGDMTILVNKEKGIHISEATCPNHTCVKQGWIKSIGYPLVCVPNGVHVIITNSSPDQDIIIG